MELEIIKKDGKTLLLVPEESIAKLNSLNSETAKLSDVEQAELADSKARVAYLESPEGMTATVFDHLSYEGWMEVGKKKFGFSILSDAEEAKLEEPAPPATPPTPPPAPATESAPLVITESPVLPWLKL